MLRAAAFSILFILTSSGGTMASAGASARDIHVFIKNGPDGTHRLEGEFVVAASTSAVWEILTDYDHMPAFISSVRSSRRVRRQSDGWMVDQVMTGNVGFFRKRVHLLLDVKENPVSEITFEDVSRSSFKSYMGTWRLIKKGPVMHVHYTLEATPAFFAPDFIAVGAFKKTVKRLLEEVRQEIIQRSKWAATMEVREL